MIHTTRGTYRRFSSHKTAADIVQWDYGSWPDGLPKKDGAHARSGAGSLDTATTCLSKTSRTKNFIIEKAGTHNAGAARQYNGRLGKVDVCRVDTCLTYANGGLWAIVDGELFLPEEWFGAAFAQRRKELGIPAERRFETKSQLGLKMIKRVKGHGLPFDLLACDALYGRDSQFRAAVDAEGVWYAAQVPADTHVYRSEPRVGIPPKRGKRGRPCTRLQVLSGQRPQEVRALAQHPQTVWERAQVRYTERGRLTADFAVRRVWTVAAGQRPRAEWLVIRRNSEGDRSYTCSMPRRTPHRHG